MICEATWLAVIHYFFNEHLLEAVVRRCSAKKVFLQSKKFTAKNLCLWSATLLKKRLLQVFECETFGDTFLIEQPRWLHLFF